jgi:hypothetical protein
MANQLIVEAHQSDEIMGPVQAVIPNTPEAKRMILMMNKNVPSYIGNVLRDQGMPETFLIDLGRASCCPTQVLEMANCSRGLDNVTLTTHQEEAKEKNQIILETASWFKNAFADLDSVVDGKTKKPAPPPETLFNLEEDRSIKTVHHHHEQAATTTGSTPPWEGKGKVVNVASSDEESASSSSQDRPRTKAAIGDEDFSASSDEDDGNAQGAANGG